MSISHTRPLPRLRFILLAAIAAAATATASFGAAEAQAHGTCQATATPPYKTAAGNIRSDGTMSCTESHRALTVTVTMYKLEGSNWAPLKTGRPGQSTGSFPANATVVVPCADTDNYRASAQGYTGRDSTDPVHESKNTSPQATIVCTPQDMTNPAALLELALFA